MRDIQEHIDASWFTDINQQKIHKKFKEQAPWMMVDLARLPNICTEILKGETNLLQTAEIIGKARMVAEIRQIGHSAKKSEEDVKYWDRFTKNRDRLRC